MRDEVVSPHSNVLHRVVTTPIVETTSVATKDKNSTAMTRCPRRA
jgi:hypothetical protein